MNDAIQDLTISVSAHVPQLSRTGALRPVSVQVHRAIRREEGLEFDYRRAAMPLIREIASQWRDAKSNVRAFVGQREGAHLYRPSHAAAVFTLDGDTWTVDCIDELLAEIDAQDKKRTDAIIDGLVKRIMFEALPDDKRPAECSLPECNVEAACVTGACC